MFNTLQEIAQHKGITETYKQVKNTMESSTDKGYFDKYEANIFGTGIRQDDPLKAAEKQRLKKILETTSLQTLCEKAGYVPRAREFIAKSGTTGISGAAYLIPDKVHQVLAFSAVETDECAAISKMMLGPDQIPGASVKIDVEIDESYKPRRFSSGGSMAEEEFATEQCTLTPISWGININIGNDLIEDSQFDVVQMHIEQAGREMGEYATNEALTILSTAPDGDGVLNAGASGNADETLWDGGATTDIDDAINGITADGFSPDILVTSKNCWRHSIGVTMGGQYNEAQSEDRFFTQGWPTFIAGMNITFTNCDVISINKTFVDQVTVLATKNFSLVTGRKRWLRIQNYTEPVMDLIGATVTARQDSVSLYKDSIFTLTET